MFAFLRSKEIMITTNQLYKLIVVCSELLGKKKQHNSQKTGPSNPPLACWLLQCCFGRHLAAKVQKFMKKPTCYELDSHSVQDLCRPLVFGKVGVAPPYTAHHFPTTMAVNCSPSYCYTHLMPYQATPKGQSLSQHWSLRCSVRKLEDSFKQTFDKLCVMPKPLSWGLSSVDEEFLLRRDLQHSLTWDSRTEKGIIKASMDISMDTVKQCTAQLFEAYRGTFF